MRDAGWIILEFVPFDYHDKVHGYSIQMQTA
jgi:hypothetical protein